MAKRRASEPPTKNSANGLSGESEPFEVIRANVNREVLMSPTFVSMYTNDTQIQTSPWDVRLVFGEIQEGPTQERPTAIIKRVGEVRMSPQHAKRIVALIVRQLQDYEQKFGPIPQPTN